MEWQTNHKDFHGLHINVYGFYGCRKEIVGFKWTNNNISNTFSKLTAILMEYCGNNIDCKIN
jgi:hypothetical protein